jgi:hypothetical protein
MKNIGKIFILGALLPGWYCQVSQVSHQKIQPFWMNIDSFLAVKKGHTFKDVEIIRQIKIIVFHWKNALKKYADMHRYNHNKRFSEALTICPRILSSCAIK